MTAYNLDPEPDVLLLDGTRVCQALFEWCVDLIAHGHTIIIDEDDAVYVSPPCNPDVSSLLAASYAQTRAIVAELTGPHTIH